MGTSNGLHCTCLYPYVSLDQSGQLDRQLVQIGDVQEEIAVDAFDARLVVADGCGDEEDALASVFLLDPSEIFLGCRAVVTVVSRLTVGYQDQELHVSGRRESRSAT